MPIYDRDIEKYRRETVKELRIVFERFFDEEKSAEYRKWLRDEADKYRHGVSLLVRKEEDAIAENPVHASVSDLYFVFPRLNLDLVRRSQDAYRKKMHGDTEPIYSDEKLQREGENGAVAGSVMRHREHMARLMMRKRHWDIYRAHQKNHGKAIEKIYNDPIRVKDEEEIYARNRKRKDEMSKMFENGTVRQDGKAFMESHLEYARGANDYGYLSMSWYMWRAVLKVENHIADNVWDLIWLIEHCFQLKNKKRMGEILINLVQKMFSKYDADKAKKKEPAISFEIMNKQIAYIRIDLVDRLKREGRLDEDFNY